MIDTKALRQKILDMAIRGELVPQDPNDEPASVLLEKIRVEKQKLIKEGKIKKDKVDSVIFKGEDNRHYEKSGKDEPVCIEDELPFEIPGSWEWVRLGTIFQHNTGKALNSSNTKGIKRQYITTSNLYWGNFELDNLREMLFTDEETEKCSVSKGDLLVCEGGDIGRAAVWNYDFSMCIQNHIHKLRPYYSVNVDFYYYVFCVYKNNGLIGGKGIGIQGLSANALDKLIIPLPSLAEQKRIVERIEKLFAQIDIIDKNQAEIETLYDELKKHTLNLAIQGKLVPQDENDEPASVLLEKIRAEKKAQLGKKYVESYIYKGDDNRYYEHIDGIDKDEAIEVPFDLPDNWIWSRIQNISESYIGLTYNPSDIVQENGYIVLRSSNIQNGKLDLTDIVRVDASITDKLHVKNNDIIICARNGSKKLVGKSAIVDVDLPNLTFGAFMATCKTPLYRYVYEFLQSSLFFSQLAGVSGTTTINQLTQASFNSFLIPIPPLDEQKRIVDKINEIFAKL